MKRSTIAGIILAVLTVCLTAGNAAAQDIPALKDVYKDFFLVGGALNSRVVTGRDVGAVNLAVTHYNTATPENDMKWEVIHPEPDRYNWRPADNLVNFAEEHGMVPIGHCLVWDTQIPQWVFVDDEGNDLTRDALLERMKEHITQVITRYKGRIKGWDVVNEALNDDGTMFETPWMRIIGEGKPEQKYDHIIAAFEYAQQADPDLELYYNDYSLEWRREKCDAAAEIVKVLKSHGKRIDAVGIQLHGNLYTSIANLTYAINTLAATGVKVNVSEMDIQLFGSDVDTADTYETQKRIADKYADFFKVFIEYADVMDRVTFWGVYDGASWISGSPLLFDTQYQPKQAFYSVVEVGQDASVPSFADNESPPETFRLLGNFPNPFNPSTTIQFELPEQSHVRLNVYSISGQRVQTLLDRPVSEGIHTVSWEPGGLSAGLYLYFLETGNKRLMGKMLYLK